MAAHSTTCCCPTPPSTVLAVLGRDGPTAPAMLASDTTCSNGKGRGVGMWGQREGHLSMLLLLLSTLCIHNGDYTYLLWGESPDWPLSCP